MKVLIAEDDEHTRAGLIEILEAEGYETVVAKDGAEAEDLFETESPDFVCLDIMMPNTDGYEVCRRIRSRNAAVPVVFISAKSEEIDKVVGLELGADDFIVKPFGVKEVIARVRAITRRCMAAKGNDEMPISFTMGDIEVFPCELRAKRGDDVIDLSLRDVKILDLLCRNQGKVLDRTVIFNRCWGAHYAPNSRTLDQHISQLRKRIEKNPKEPAIIRTVHGAGYRYDG